MSRCAFVILLLFSAVLLARCGPAVPPFECTDAIGCVEIAPDEPMETPKLA